ncbi:hypothetical protein AGMMS49965_18430 [Bacteroidia bacterium]|nr:hypothetical protein AGMMS49965_18430 [Bacteroidia bacterium]
MKKYSLLLTLFICTLCSAAAAKNEIRLNDNWEFVRGDLGSVWEVVRPVAKNAPEAAPVWEEVALPHCFNAEDAVDPDVNYYQGPGWYRTELVVQNPYPQGRTLLHFEGAGQKTDVYIYTQHVANHVGGYDEWTVDITDAVNEFAASDDAARFKGKIPLIIRCDNSRDTEMLPSDMSDFNVYGGIYRYLNLIYTPQVSLENMTITAQVDEKGKWTLDIQFKLYDPKYLSVMSSLYFNIQVFDPQGKSFMFFNGLGLRDKPVRMADGMTLSGIKNPQLWSPDSPALYTCRVTLGTGTGENEVVAEQKFGFRHFEFKEHGAFFLNGKRLLLRGTHRHEDHAGLGAAMTEDLIIREMEMLRAMGANFIRLGHYQQSRIVLEQCDRLGILVWEEIPWCRGGLGGEEYQQQAKRMLTNMIEQHRNHPSVILWGLGNENDWAGDFREFDKQKIRAFMQELHNLSHRLDNTRKTAIRRCDFCKDIVDVYSPSIWAGWYRGQMTDYKQVSEEEMQRVKHFLHVEWGGDSHAGRHAEDPYRYLGGVKSGQGADERMGDATLYGGDSRAARDGEWSETYICNLIDWHLKEQETMPWLTGAAYWPFKDFSTPIRPENPIPYMNQKGVVERDLTPKESYYVFQSYWTDAPMVHIYGHSWATRWGDANETKDIRVYSNCPEVELFLNGKSLGIKKRHSQDFPAAGLRWKSALKAGSNTLKAIGKHGKSAVTDEIAFEYETRTFGKPAEIQVRILDEAIAGQAHNDEVWLEAELRDANGVVSLEARNFISFESVGDGKLVVNQGTSTGSKKVQARNGRARIKLIKNHGKNIVAVKSDGLKTVFVTIE